MMRLIFYNILASLWSEASKTYLGFLWWFIEPLLVMVVYYVVFGVLMIRGGGTDFMLFLLCGIMVWFWFTKSVSGSAASIIGGKSLIHQKPIKKWYFPAVIVGKVSFQQVFVLTALLGLLLAKSVSPTIVWLALLPVLGVEFLMIVSLAFTLAAIVPFVPDLRVVLPRVMQFMLFISGIFYSVETIPEEYQELFLLNPVAFLIHSVRLILLSNQWPDWERLGVITVLSLALLTTVLIFFKRADKLYPRVVY